MKRERKVNVRSDQSDLKSQQQLDKPSSMFDAVAVRSFVARKLSIELIDKLQAGSTLEEIGLMPPENGQMDTETWLNYNVLLILKLNHKRVFDWYMTEICRDNGYAYWGLNPPK